MTRARVSARTSARGWTLLAGLGSALLLAGAYGFQALGYAPCQMCLWQRWPHFAAAAIAIVALVVPARVLAIAGMLAALTTAAIGLYHSGVEKGWWAGPSSCAGGGDISGLSGTELLSTDVLDQVVMCDQVSWAFAGLSMASWNAVMSAVLALMWAMAATRQRRA